MAEYWNQKAQTHIPLLSFDRHNNTDWLSWQQKARQKLVALLGELPVKVPLDPEIVYSLREGDIIRERVVFDV